MLLGRGAELEQIGRLVADAREGHGRALLIVGEPGIGKTSLLAEAVALAGDLRVIEAEAVEAEASLPYALIGEIRRAHSRAARGAPRAAGQGDPGRARPWTVAGRPGRPVRHLRGILEPDRPRRRAPAAAPGR